MSHILNPYGGRFLPTGAKVAGQAVEEYDANLTLAQHENGEWIVMKKDGPEGLPFPVFNFGRELPSADHVKARLAECDVRRNSKRICDAIERKHVEAEKAARDKMHDHAGEVAEAAEWALRKAGATRHKKVYMSGRRAK